MKILDLKLKAFGPFLSEQHINFTKLNDKGMFLINGPTGTGKTSLFDAIVFALYGKGSGKDRDDGKSLRSDFAKDDESTFVELTFEANGQIYKIYRQPPYTRKAKKGGGTTQESAKVELYLPDNQVLSKSSDVDNKLINEILFINREQFKTVALLAQGEFTELITASSKDRAAILEHIFEKEIYDDFQKRISELSKKKEEEMKMTISSVNTLINKVEGGEEVIGFNESLADPANIPTFLNNLNELIEKIKVEHKDKEKETNSALNEFNDASSRLQTIKSNNELFQKYIDAVNKQKELENEALSMRTKEILMNNQIEFDSLKPLFNQLISLEESIKSCDKEIENAKNNLLSISETKKWLTDNKEKYESNKKQIDAVNKTILSLNDIDKDKENLIKDKNNYLSQDKKYSDDYKQYKKKEEDFLDLKERFFASASYNLAKLLEEGKPCPVCGSTTHPNIAHATNPVSEKEFKDAEERYNLETKEITDQRNKLTSLKSTIETKENAIIDSLKRNGFTGDLEVYISSNKLNEEINELNIKLSELKAFNTDYENKDKQTAIDESKYTQIEKNAKNTIDNSKVQMQKVNDDINTKLESNAYITSRDKYYNHEKPVGGIRLKPININETKKVLEDYKNAKASQEAIINNTPKDIIDRGSIDENDLQQEVSQKKQIFDDLNKQTSILNNKISNLKKDVKEIEEAYYKCKTIIDDYTSLNELSKTTNGFNRLKLSFKMYILADYFDKIIAQANYRLSRITNRRYRLVRRDDLGKGNSQQGLDLDVYDVETGKERPASSLSGGEKFVSALSLALGLSDIIETNHALIQVESIFIDEGFGSLDENYLDMAMKALETLKDDNKTVAIISHVEKLKEYIPDGLEIKKAEVGSRVLFKENI